MPRGGGPPAPRRDRPSGNNGERVYFFFYYPLGVEREPEGRPWATWALIPFMLFWMAWPNWGATLYGEVRGAKDFRKNIYQMLGGLLVPTVIALCFLALMTWKVGYQAFMGTMAAFWWGISPLGGDYISPTAMISWIVPNAAFQVILIAAISLLLFGWFGTLFLSSTRMIFASAFDRILPEGAAKVTSGGVPVVALVWLAGRAREAQR